MVFEHATLEVDADRVEMFEEAARAALPQIAAADGCHGARLFRSVERPGSYRLIVAWDTLEAHVIDFVASDILPRVGGLLAPFLVGEPTVDHFAEVAAA